MFGAVGEPRRKPIPDREITCIGRVDVCPFPGG